MPRIAGWTAYDEDPEGRRGEREWSEGGPRLARLDVRVDDEEDDYARSVTWLLSDAVVEYLGIRREDGERVARTFDVPIERLAWWNDHGPFAGIVIMVSSWAAAGVVGGAVSLTR